MVAPKRVTDEKANDLSSHMLTPTRTMGRWTVRSSNGSKPTNGSIDVWLYNSTRKDLIRYLKAYREMVNLEVRDESTRNQDSNATEEKIDCYLKNDWKRDEPIWLANVEFPPLISIASEPYWIVQVDLSSRQRKVVHNACVETDLFHVTHDGFVVISAFADGLDALPGWNLTSSHSDIVSSTSSDQQPLYLYKPWVCENCSSKQNEADKAIHLLIDHPSDCLREERDGLCYQELYNADLSDFPELKISPFEYVDTVDKWKLCLEILRNCHELAFDIEAFASQRYTQITCLLQFATESGDEFIVDPLVPALWDCLKNDLAPIFADPSVVKIGHSISGLDARCLHRDFGCFIVNAFDTYQAAKVLDLPSQGLASICSHYGLPASHYLQLKADYQTSDWRQRPLSDEQLDYARSDVRYLHMIRKLMMRDLVKNDFWDLVPQTEESMEQERQEIEAWRQSLLRMEMLEDGMITEKEAMDTSADPLDFWRPSDSGETEDEDDAVTFTTSRDCATVGANTSPGDHFLTPANSDDDFQKFNFDSAQQDCGQMPTKSDISVHHMRMQAMLMRCLWLSQEGCRDYWTTLVEPHLRNETFLDLQKRMKKNEIEWDLSNTKLYEDLAQWREQVAISVGCLPGFTMSLDYLAIVAWKRPTTELSLRRIRYDLPHVLEAHQLYRNQLLDTVLRNAAETGATISCDMTYFGKRQSQARSFWIQNPSGTPVIEKIGTTAFRCAIAVTLGAAVLGAVVDLSRRKSRL